MVVNTGYSRILQMLAAKANLGTVKIGVGDNPIPVTLDDTATVSGGNRYTYQVNAGTPSVSGGYVVYPFTLTTGLTPSAFTIYDIGLLFDNVLIARIVLDEPLGKTTSNQYTGQFKIKATREANSVLTQDGVTVLMSETGNSVSIDSEGKVIAVDGEPV